MHAPSFFSDHRLPTPKIRISNFHHPGPTLPPPTLPPQSLARPRPSFPRLLSFPAFHWQPPKTREAATSQGDCIMLPCQFSHTHENEGAGGAARENYLWEPDM